MNDIFNYVFCFAFLFIIAFLYHRHENKKIREKTRGTHFDYNQLQQYLLTGDDLINHSDKITKPILWICLKYEYNSRNWKSFGSRSSFDLNQPYLYLTVRSLIQQCGESFHICIIDSSSFSKLIPQWNIEMKKISEPLHHNICELGMMKLLYRYGGIRVPPSFVCMRDLYGLYDLGISSSASTAFICEMVDRDSSSVDKHFCPNLGFMGCEKESSVMNELIEFMQRNISSDYTDETHFLGKYSRWCEKRIEQNQIILIDGKLIGTKNMENESIIIDDLFSNDYIDLYPQTYGIYIPADEVLKRTKYQWFARMSEEQLLQSSFVLAKYLLLSNAPDAKQGILTPMEEKPSWISFWKVPSGLSLWGMKPNYLGNQVPKENERHYR